MVCFSILYVFPYHPCDPNGQAGGGLEQAQKRLTYPEISYQSELETQAMVVKSLVSVPTNCHGVR